MIDHRRLQRILFRMQLDPAFAAAVMGGKERSEDRLGEKEREMLARAGLAGILADHGGRRRAQILGNIASEFVLTLAEVERRRIGLDVLRDFPASEPFHAAIRLETALPLAFGAWLRDRTAAAGLGVAASLAALESAMATARRELRQTPPPAAGELVLGPRAWLVTLPDGAFNHAQAVRGAVDASEPVPAAAQRLEMRAVEWLSGARGAASTEASPALETVLLVVSDRADHRLRDVVAERLEPVAAELLHALRRPLAAAACDAFASERGFEPADAQEFLKQLVADGVLVRG